MVDVRTAPLRAHAATDVAAVDLDYLPPYNPDFNPIKQAFAERKHLLRTAAGRTVRDLRDAIRRAFTSFAPRECRNYLTAVR